MRTPCWADDPRGPLKITRTDGSTYWMPRGCDSHTDDPLGLCPIHREEIVP